MQAFPFALVSLNITKWSLDLIAAGKFHAMALKRNTLVDTCEKWYIGTFYQFHQLWLKRPGTILEVGVRMTTLEKTAKAKLPAMLSLAKRT
jgi:hypothetical protein